jgi:hypothetical protein
LGYDINVHWVDTVDEHKFINKLFCLFIIPWNFEKQRIATRSSIEAEYKVLAYGTIKVLYTLLELWLFSVSIAILWCDN